MQDRDTRQSIDIVDGEVSRTIKQFVSLIGDDGKAQFTTHDATSIGVKNVRSNFGIERY